MAQNVVGGTDQCRWRISLNGRRVMAAAVKLREVAYPGLYAAARVTAR